MLRTSFVFAVVMLGIFFFSFQSQGIETRRGENVNASGKYSENLFLVGERVRSTVESTDDVFMAGATISQNGGAAENLFMAGGDIEIRNPSVRMAVIAGGNVSISESDLKDLILAGGNIRLNSSHIQDDLILAGGQIEIDSKARVDDSVVITGGQVHFAGTAGGDVEITGNRVELTGIFAKNVRVQAQELIIGPNAQIAGNLIRGARKVNISPTAQIHGQTEALPISGTESFDSGSKILGLFLGLLFGAGLLLSPALVAFVFPQFVQGGADRIRHSFWESVGKGTVTFIVAPVLLIFLFTTVIGVPVALFAIPFYFVAALVAWSITVLAVGLQLRVWFKGSKLQPQAEAGSRMGIFGLSVLGALVLMLVLMIPFIGFVVSVVLFWAGLGALYAQMRGTPLKPKPVMKSGESTTAFFPAGTQA